MTTPSFADAKASIKKALEEFMNLMNIWGGIDADATASDGAALERLARAAGLTPKADEPLLAIFNEIKTEVGAVAKAQADEGTARANLEKKVSDLETTIGELRAQAKAFQEEGAKVFASLSAVAAQLGNVPNFDEELQKVAAESRKATEETVAKALAGGERKQEFRSAVPPEVAKRGAEIERKSGYKN